MTAPSCPEAQHLLAFATGRLDEQMRDEVSRHLGTCASCRKSVDAAVDELRQAETRDVVPVPEKRPRPAPVAHRPPPQRVDRYLVLELLGAGGMGEVLLAYDPVLDRRVAIKLARRLPDDDTQSLEARLRREAQSLARVVDPHVVAVYDAGNVDGRPFVAMEYVPGATLKGWLKRPRTRHEVLRMFLGAARGLAAAHRVGVVHRDFKPDNVLVDAKGNARVTDFGLATLLDAPQEPRPSSGVDVSAEDTQQVFTSRDDVAVGTPGYMPPEQWEGRTTDARSDQFSFCVALHEGLMGERPFGRPTARHSLPDFTGRPEAEKKRRELPAVLRVLLERGLALDPQARFPSMEPIIAALERALRPRRTWLAVAAVLVGVGLAGGTLAALRSPCHGALGRIEAVRKGAALSLPVRLAARVDAAAGRFEAAWASAWTDACVDTHERREQPAEVLALRNECLARQSRRYQLVLGQLATPKEAVRAAALEALETAQRPDACLALEGVLSVDQPAPTARAAVQTLEEQLLEARVLIDVGRYEDAATALAALSEPVARAAFGRTTALHRYLEGYLALREQRFRDARPLLREGFSRAVAARDLLLAARAGSEVVFVSGYALGFLDEAALVGELTRGLVQRLDSREEEARLENALGLVAMAQGQLDVARKHLEAARALRVALYGPGHLETAKVVGNLGLLARSQGRLDEAEALLREDLAVREAALGSAHPQVAVALVNVATLAGNRGRHEEAAALLQRALDIRRGAFGEGHPLVLATRSDLALAFTAAGRFDEARAQQQDVLAKARASHGDESVEVADALDALAATEEVAGRLPAALEATQQALALYRKELPARDDAVMNARHQEAELLIGLGRFEEAEARLEPLTREWRAEPDSTGSLAAVLISRGKLRVLQRQGARAVPLLDEAQRLLQPLAWHPARLAEVAFLLAQAQAQAGHHAEALAQAQSALALYEKASKPDDVQAVEVWMKAHR